MYVKVMSMKLEAARHTRDAKPATTIFSISVVTIVLDSSMKGICVATALTERKCIF